MKNSNDKPKINEEIIKKRLNDTLFQYFYSFGIEPDSLDIAEIKPDKQYLEKDYKKVSLLTKFPPFDRSESNIDPNIILAHCFPHGYYLVESQSNINDEYFHFNFENLLTLSEENNRLYFGCVIIYEPLISYLNIKYNKNIPEFTSCDNKEFSLKHEVHKIYIPKVLCLSSFVPFPQETKLLMKELLKYTRSDDISLPLERILETIIFGIPRPLKAYFYVSCNKNKLIPKQSKDIEFILSEFNQYNINSYPYQTIFIMTPTSISTIFKGLLLEIPILFFCSDKDILTDMIESFLNLLYPLEYQYPHISILPDCYAGLIEIEKSFVFGINEQLIIKKVGKRQIPEYFLRNNINVTKRAFILVDVEKGKSRAFCDEINNYHVVDFNDLGKYNDSTVLDPILNVSKDLYTGKVTDITEDNLPERYNDKFEKKLEEYIKKIQSQEYNLNVNKKIGEEIFYYFLASLFISYNSYLFNGQDEITRICTDILSKKQEEIKVDNLFLVNGFLNDNKSDAAFYSLFFKTKIFRNFLIRKYLNLPLDRYKFLHFDEKILEKKNKNFFFRRVKTVFTSSKEFQSTHIYQVKEPKNFSEEEKLFINKNKQILLRNYYQNIDDKNKIKYALFPKLIYDDKYFQKKYKPSISLLADKSLNSCLRGYQQIEDYLKGDAFKALSGIYNGDLVNRYIIDINKIVYGNEVMNMLNKVWVIIFCMTFYYCNDIEKHFRFEELMNLLPDIIDNEEQLLKILLTTVKRHGDESMTLKIFESIKNINYGEYSCLCSKFKDDSKMIWDLKTIEVSNSKFILSYLRDQKSDNERLLEVPTVDYDIKSLKKRTFYISNEQGNNVNENEKISFDLFFKCQNCGEEANITGLVVSLTSKTKNNVMICTNCNKLLRPVNHVVYGMEKEEFVIYSPMELYDVAKDIMKENGTSINMDDLRTKYKTFFWNCILYFHFNGLSFEMLLKYKNEDKPKEKTVEKKVEKKKRKVFKILEFENQDTNV